MKKASAALITLVVVMSLGSSAYGQYGKCAGTNKVPLVLRCPNCGDVYYNYPTYSCDLESDCYFWENIKACCGEYDNYDFYGSYCQLAMFKNPDVRSRLLELAKTRQILVPDCQGAYLPAGLIFKNLQVSDDASL